MRQARTDGPQHVSVRGREEVVIVSAEEFRRLNCNLTGGALVEAARASPHKNVELAPKSRRLPVRGITL